MEDTEQEDRTHRFGVFELDLRKGELRKHGVRLKLQQQPLQVLGILLERAGGLVTREEIQKRLWPEDTYVDFDNAINGSIRKLRDVLSDSSDTPRFIETLPRRGYRFIAPVAGVPVASTTAVALENGRRIWWLVAAATAISLALGTALGLWFSKSKPNTGTANALLSAVPFTSYPGFEVLPDFSPEGTRVAFSWQQPGAEYPDVYLKLLGTGSPVRLSSAGGIGAAWSQDGRFVAYLRPLDSWHAAVVVIPAIGGQEREVTRITFASSLIVHRYGWAIPAPFLAWSPDAKWLLTLDQQAPGKSQPHAITRVSVETGEKRILTSPVSGNLGDGGLALTQDGKRLAFTHHSGLWARDIYVTPLSGEMLFSGKLERVTFDNKAIAGIAWTGDGKSLVLASPRNGRPELWKIAAERGSHPVRLNLTDDEVTDIAISRDGKRLVYSRQIQDQNIWRASLNGQHLTAPSSFIASTRRDTQAHYSPDGKRIVFESNRSGNEEIWMCGADGSHPVQLTYFGNAWAGSPKWSPDGAKVAFDSNAAGTWDVYVVSAGGGKPKRMTSDGADYSWPSWSRDGKWLYYFSNRGKEAQIWKMPAGGGPGMQVTRNGGLRSNESADGQELYYTTEEGLWKVPVAGGKEVEIGPSYMFAPRQNGIYYAPGSPGSVRSNFPINFLDFKTQRTRTIGVLPGPLGWDIDVSPDGRWIIYGKFGREGSELMLVEKFF